MENSSHQVAHQFDDQAQQREASTLGMWVFLITEILFFGALFLAYTVYRAKYPLAFAAASHHLDVLLGGVNTAVLLTSSLTVALAVHAAQEGRNKAVMVLLAVTIVLALAFVGIKSVEYHHKFEEHLVPGNEFVFAGPYGREAEIFFVLYFMMTGLHALHVIIGIGLFAVLIGMAKRKRFSSAYNSPVEIGGLYWHFVDIVWIFLYPLLYLISLNRS